MLQCCLTCLLLSQVFHSDVSQHCACHQSSQYTKHNAHYIVVADQDHCTHIMNLPVDRDLNKNEKENQQD